MHFMKHLSKDIVHGVEAAAQVWVTWLNHAGDLKCCQASQRVLIDLIDYFYCRVDASTSGSVRTVFSAVQKQPSQDLVIVGSLR